MSEIPLHPYDPDEERFSHGRPQDPPIDVEYIQHLRDQAERSSDGVWVNPEVLEHLVAVFESACVYIDTSRANIHADGLKHSKSWTTSGLSEAVDRARGAS